MSKQENKDHLPLFKEKEFVNMLMNLFSSFSVIVSFSNNFDMLALS